jgi:hypothetical protein
MKVLGVLLILAGIGIGLYFGVWWAFVGGIIQIIEQVRAEHLDAMMVATGIAKVMFAGLIGWGAGAICLIPGAALLNR